MYFINNDFQIILVMITEECRFVQLFETRESFGVNREAQICSIFLVNRVVCTYAYWMDTKYGYMFIDLVCIFLFSNQSLVGPASFDAATGPA